MTHEEVIKTMSKDRGGLGDMGALKMIRDYVKILRQTRGGQDLCSRLTAYRQIVAVDWVCGKKKREMNVKVRKCEPDNLESEL